MGIHTVKVEFPLFDNKYNLNLFMSFENKKDISLICRYRNKHLTCNFDISHYRLYVFDMLGDSLIKECFGKISYGGKYYKGQIGINEQSYPSSLSKLQKLNEYKFNLCFENVYDYMSYGQITEKITDCFKSKTIPIYWGNQNTIPQELYIDFKNYLIDNEVTQEGVNKLVEHLKSITKDQYIEMTEKAFEWEKENKLGNIEELKGILDND
jgi:hypothetical protein